MLYIFESRNLTLNFLLLNYIINYEYHLGSGVELWISIKMFKNNNIVYQIKNDSGSSINIKLQIHKKYEIENRWYIKEQTKYDFLIA